MKLKTVTITGADDHNDPNQLAELSEQYPFVEWGILYSKSQAGNTRFPSNDWISNKLKPIHEKTQMQLSGHICGSWVKKICRGKWVYFCGEAYNWWIMDRIQINFGSYINRISFDKFKDIFNAVDMEIILQIDNNPRSMRLYNNLKDVYNVSPFFDSSAGVGICTYKYRLPLSKWQGYAGGLSPENVVEQLKLIEEVVPEDHTIWIDVESHVHTDRIGLDMKRVENFLKATEPFVNKE